MPFDITKTVVMLEVTSRSLSACEPYRNLGRDKAMGTGFRVANTWFPAQAAWNTSAHMLFLTNWHVVDSCERQLVRVRTASSPEYCKGKVVVACPRLDFAVVAVAVDAPDADEDDPFCSAPASVLGNVANMELHVGPLKAEQQRVLCCGFPSALEAYVTTGILGGRNSGGDVSDFWQIDASVNSGNSGGPVVLADDHRCFGIATATEAAAEQIAYATPVSSILDWFRFHWSPGTCIGRLPRWGFTLCPRTDAFDEAHGFPRTLNGAVVANVRKADDSGELEAGDVLVSIQRNGTPVCLDKFGTVTDFCHGQPRFVIQNMGFLASLSPTTTTVTVWRPSLRAQKTFVCTPAPPLAVERAYHQEYEGGTPYCLLGSLCLLNASPDFLRHSEVVDSDDEADGISPLATFHVLRHVQAQKALPNPKHVVVLSHMHPNAYVSSTRTLSVGDVVRAINGTTLKSVAHAERLVRRAAADFAARGQIKHITLSTPDKTVYLSLQKLLQEETLCLPERDHTKLHLLCAAAQHAARRGAASAAAPRKRRRESRRLRTQRERRSISAAKLHAVLDLQESGSPTAASRPASRPGSRPGSPPRAPAKRRRSRRLQAPRPI